MRSLIKLEENPDVKIINNIYDYLSPQNIYIPILENKKYHLNDYIYKATFFGEEIASVSGKITGSTKVLYKNKLTPALIIKNDYQENVETKKRKKKITNREELINLLKKFNLDNIISKLVQENIQELLISSIDEEVYSLREFICLQNKYQEILETINELLTILNIPEGSIVIKSTNSKSIQNVRSIIGMYPNIKINLVPDKYLISKDDFLCEYLDKKKDNVIILTTNEIYEVYGALFKAKDITESLITISGDAILKSLVINTKLGVSLEKLVDKFITVTTTPYDIYINGYLSGIKVNNIKDIIVTREIKAIIFKKREDKEEEECINCGACMKICPYKINVKKCYFHNLKHNNCIGCGLCNYICPANIDLKKIVKGD